MHILNFKKIKILTNTIQKLLVHLHIAENIYMYYIYNKIH